MNRLERGHLSRRERQIIEILYRLGQGTAKEVQENLPDPPSYSAVRALLATLEGKDMVKHSKEGRRYVYKPSITPKKAKRTALSNLLTTYFAGSPESLVASLLDPSDQQLSKKDIDSIRDLLTKK
ncbi:MAG: BlaI/MecI/CopY family transcriptional regulator [Akkermansiaceae bacterium]|jgi:predicted transcriptional regulator|nr:BlaI/MecI/CopY family transcriptional regulator [Akkermansiaceae bacterium]|tara:strand:+ start:540 stop:914 length:375 start_codon:yes stop_codon:yes gene_type:complete